MSRSYKHISQYEKEIYELREIGKHLGFTREQVRGLIKRNNKNQRIIDAGEALGKKGRPCKNKNVELPLSIQKLDKLAQMRYALASRERYIKQLEMENELLRVFLSHTERK